MPLWGGGRLDMYYWYYGTLAFHARQEKDWNEWYSRLEQALVPRQRTDPASVAGSWDPAGPWGKDGGRVYSTAISALALATPYRMSAEFLTGKPTPAYASAVKALAKLARSANAPVRARAEIWLRRAGR